jgi:hypothetical protein
MAASRLTGGADRDGTGNAAALAGALGRLKGPLVKVAQLMATVPDLLPADYATELQKLQSDAPPMGWVFVKRRMAAELGPDWMDRFGSFDKKPRPPPRWGRCTGQPAHDGRGAGLQAAISRHAVGRGGRSPAQLKLLFALHRQFDGAIDTSEIAGEIGDRVREELDYVREAGHARLYGAILADEPLVRVPTGVHAGLSTRRLLTWAGWRAGSCSPSRRPTSTPATGWRGDVHGLVAAVQRFGVIHGDPHLGNYTVFEEEGRAGGINLLDYGCIRIFPPSFVGGVVDLYEGLKTGMTGPGRPCLRDLGVPQPLAASMIDTLNIWARFIYGPLLDDRVRTMADGVSPGEYGRKEALKVRQELKKLGAVTVPREFVFMDRAAIGLGAVFLHLRRRAAISTDLFNQVTYLRFIALAKWGTVFCIVLLMIFGAATSLVPWALTLLVGAAMVLGAIYF